MDRMCHIASTHLPMFYNTSIDSHPMFLTLCIFFTALRIYGIIFLLVLVCSMSVLLNYILHEGRDPTFHDFSSHTNPFSSVAQSCLTLCDPMDCSTPGFTVYHQLPELAQTHIHRVGDVIQPSHPLSSRSLPAFNLFQLQGLFQRVSSLHQVAKVLELQLQYFN